MIRASIFSALLALSTAMAETPVAQEWVQYGQPATIETAPLQAATFLADPSAHVDQKILVEGRVADVCQKAGCWMVLAEGDKSIRVLTRDHGFAVAKDSTGQTARIEGMVRAKEIKPEEVAHYEGESGNKAVIPEKKVQGTQTFELIASGVQLLRPKQ